jgi:DNA-binding response OmpR family regulator
MISARAGKLDHDFAFTVGADAYVKKPFPYSEIVARLALLAPAAREAAPVLRRAPRIGRRLAQPVLATG